MIRNIADFERKLTDFDIREALKEELAFEADVVILAIGENASSPKTDEARQRFADALKRICSLSLASTGIRRFLFEASSGRILKKTGS